MPRGQRFPLSIIHLSKYPELSIANDRIGSVYRSSYPRCMQTRKTMYRIGIIENMAYLLLADGTKENIFGENGAKEMSEKLNIEFINEIPLDKKIRESSDNGLPFVIAHPNNLTKDIFISSAKKVEKILENKP